MNTATTEQPSAIIDTPDQTKTYKPSAICFAFPPIPPDESEEIIESLREHGLREDIVLTRGEHGEEDAILDGRHRQEWCKAAGIAPRYRYFGSRPTDGPSPTSFAWSANMHRRQVQSPSVRAAIAADLQKFWLAENADASKTETLTKAAETMKVSETYVRQAATIQEHAPEEFQAVKEGTKTIPEVAPIAEKKKRERKAKPEDITAKNPAADQVRANVAENAREDCGTEFAEAVAAGRALTTLDDLEEFSQMDAKTAKALVPLLLEGTALNYCKRIMGKEFDGHDRLSVLILRAKANNGKPLKIIVDGFQITVKPAKEGAEGEA